jgi:hypothetical protein
MKNKSTFDNAIALIRYRPDTNSLAQTLDFCQGLQGLWQQEKVLRKALAGCPIRG